jgi:PAS domain S-box-containing protein
MTDQNEKNAVEIKRLRRENDDLQRSLDVQSRKLSKLEDRETTLLNIIDGNRDGYWDWDCRNNEVSFSESWKKMLGFREDEISNDPREWKDRLHPDDRIAVINKLDRHMNGETTYYENEYRLKCKDGTYKWILDRGKIVRRDQDGRPLQLVGTQRDLTLEREIEIENHHLIEKLGEALDKVNLLNGLLPICANCKKIRDDKGYWTQIENYIRDHSEAEFSHSICPDCIREMYPEYRARGK